MNSEHYNKINFREIFRVFGNLWYIDNSQGPYSMTALVTFTFTTTESLDNAVCEKCIM
jgi:hypothetical protein